VILYIDSSIAGRVIFRQDHPLEGLESYETVASSALLSVELRRAAQRLQVDLTQPTEWLAGVLDAIAAFERSLQLVHITPPVIKRAGGPFGAPVRSLDAIHLASALLLRERTDPDLVFATHDRQQAVVARALELPCIGV
jgi:predicted nucleic acid-binding protein